jgi:Zn-finger nucleic acid-binding protein
MNCKNCGAPMTLNPDRRFYTCEYCTSLYFPEENPDGVRVLDEASSLDCPVCQLPLLHAWVDDTAVLYCGRCRGLLLNQYVFLAIIGYLRSHASGPPAPLRSLNQDELKRALTCPSCHKPMSTHPYGGPGNIVVDNCPKCQLLWLDTGELRRVITSPGWDRGQWG